MVHRKIAGLALVVTMVGGATAPAHAATAAIRDQIGDAPARYDLGRVSVSNEPPGLSLTAKVRDLSRNGTQIFIANVTPASGASYYATTIRRANGTVVDKLVRFGEDGPDNLRCDVSSRWQIGRSRIRMTIPRSCLDEDRRVSVNVAIGAGNGSSGDPADWTRTFRVGFA